MSVLFKRAICQCARGRRPSPRPLQKGSLIGTRLFALARVFQYRGRIFFALHKITMCCYEHVTCRRQRLCNLRNGLIFSGSHQKASPFSGGRIESAEARLSYRRGRKKDGIKNGSESKMKAKSIAECVQWPGRRGKEKRIIVLPLRATDQGQTLGWKVPGAPLSLGPALASVT